MRKLNFIADILNEILDDDPMASLVPADGQALLHSENMTLVMTSHSMIGHSGPVDTGPVSTEKAEGISEPDFTPDDDPRSLASKLIRVCIAKLAAKGAVARNCSLVIGVEEGTKPDWVKSFAGGLAGDLNEFGLALIHCETKACKGVSMLSMSAVGELSGEPMSVSGAVPGDLLCVSGPVGAAALGKRIFAGHDPGIQPAQAERFVAAFTKPEPNWALGSFLSAQVKGRAAINISEGLVPDLRRLARLSGVALNIDFPAIAFADNSLPVGPQLFDSNDHQLLMCLSVPGVGLVRKWFPQVVVIGHVLAGEGVQFTDSNGAPLDLNRLEADVF